jgi:hypothetical protein
MAHWELPWEGVGFGGTKEKKDCVGVASHAILFPGGSFESLLIVRPQ